MLYANGNPVGGGGGTGGHTIIDENGNSMTARAGLQFVGGANVSDDGTNNKTIVDVASAGGIDGVFIDTDNVIQASTSISTSSDTTYTATEDCALRYEIYSTSSLNGYLKVDNNWIIKTAGSVYVANVIYVKKGQTVTMRSQGSAGSYTVYGIQTGTTHSKFQPVIYSTEEREIGVWKDGKPLYQKTLVVDNVGEVTSSSQNTCIAVNDIPFDYVQVVASSIFDNSSDQRRYPLPNTPRGNANGIYYHAYLTKELSPVIFYVSLYTNSGTYSNLTDLEFTIQYTKTTDVAGSGTWTPQGVPTHHYSTDEHIIGTWIDGSTLYEKTIDFGALPNTTLKGVSTGVNNIGLVTKVNGFAYSSGDVINIPYIESNNTSSKQTIDVWHNRSLNELYINTNFDASGFYGYITIQYTKSS